MSGILFSSLLTLALGSLLCLPLISVREIGRGFFTLWVGIVGVLGAAALLLLATGRAGGTGIAGPGRIAAYLGGSLIALTGFWIVLRLGALRSATVVLLLSAIAGALALRELALEPPSRGSTGSAAVDPGIAGGSREPGAEEIGPSEDSPGQPRLGGGEAVLRVSSALLSALAVGMVTVAMVLGHWYLVQPKLKLAPLRRLCDLLVGILIARLCVTSWGFATSLRAGHRFFGGAEPIPWEVVILSQRFLFGFGGSMILAVMIKKTVELRSTMSATGLLYIAILFVWVGEFLSIYLGHLTRGGLVV